MEEDQSDLLVKDYLSKGLSGKASKIEQREILKSRELKGDPPEIVGEKVVVLRDKEIRLILLHDYRWYLYYSTVSNNSSWEAG